MKLSTIEKLCLNSNQACRELTSVGLAAAIRRQLFCRAGSRFAATAAALMLVANSTWAQPLTAVSHTIIAASGLAAPVGGNYGTFSFINVRLNARHDVAFDAFLTGPPFTFGVFVGDGTRTSTIALGVNPDPAAPSFGFPFNPFITPNGDVVFQANFSDIFRS